MAQPEVLDAERIAAQLGAAYRALDPAERASHAELLARLAGPADVVLAASPASSAAADARATWIVTICAADGPGALSLIVGTLTAHGLDVVRGDLFTLRSADAPPAATGRPAGPPARLLLDRFELRATPDSEPAPWLAIEHDLAEVFACLAAGQGDAARDLVIDRVSRSLAPAGSPAAAGVTLLPVRIDLDDDADRGALPDATTLTIRGADTRGFLFEFTNALALLEIAVQRAAVRTEAGETHDTFWVTSRDGSKLSDPARRDELRTAAVLVKQFTHLLPLVPDPALALRQFGALTRGMLAGADRRASLTELADEGVLETLAATLGVSRFLWEDFLRLQHENIFPVLTDRPALDAAKPAAVLREEARGGLPDGGPHSAGPAAADALNAFKDRELFRIDLRHVTGRSGFIEFSRELTDLAEVVVGEAAALTERELHARHGAPRLSSGAPADGRSPPSASSAGASSASPPTSSSSPSTRAWAPPTAPPRSRTRPTSSSSRAPRGHLRARPAAPAPRRGRLPGRRARGLPALLRPRRRGPPVRAHGARQAAPLRRRRQPRPLARGRPRRLRLLRRAARFRGAAPPPRAPGRELVAPGAVNAKHSRGGVVDVEYYVQARQILAGATEPAVRTTGTLAAIEALARGGHLDFDAAAKLPEAYGFLRRLIDALRVVRGNARDLAIPPRDSREFAYLARRLYYDSPDALATAIEVRMAYAASFCDTLPE